MQHFLLYLHQLTCLKSQSACFVLLLFVMVLRDSKTKAFKDAKISKSENEGFEDHTLFVAVPQNFFHQLKPFFTTWGTYVCFVVCFFFIKKPHLIHV